MSLPRTALLNQNIGMSSMLDQLSCFVQYAPSERKKIGSLVSDAIAHNFTDYAPRHATIAAQPVTLGRLSSDFEPSITPAREPRLASEPRST